MILETINIIYIYTDWGFKLEIRDYLKFQICYFTGFTRLYILCSTQFSHKKDKSKKNTLLFYRINTKVIITLYRKL